MTDTPPLYKSRKKNTSTAQEIWESEAGVREGEGDHSSTTPPLEDRNGATSDTQITQFS